jgi:hypothetical protein
MAAGTWIAVAGGGYLLFRPGGPLNGQPSLPAAAASANGIPPAFSPGTPGGGSGINLPNYPTGNATLDSALGVEQKIDHAVVSGVCSYYAKGAPICNQVGGAIAKINTLQTQLTIKGAKALYSNVLKPGAQAVVAVAKDPTVAPFAIADRSQSITSTAAVKADRAAQAAYGRLPTVLKPLAAPVVVATKVVNVTTQAAGKVTGALESGAKAGAHAVSGAVNKVLGWL